MNAAAECATHTRRFARCARRPTHSFCFVYETLTLWCMEAEKKKSI